MRTRLKQWKTWQALLSFALLFVMIHMGVRFMNAGHSYEQAVPFRIFCSCFAGLILVNMEPRYYLTWFSLAWIPVCYLLTHFGYERHLIPDVCNYQFTDVIRLGKLVVLIWGWMLIALLLKIVKEGIFARSLMMMAIVGFFEILLKKPLLRIMLKIQTLKEHLLGALATLWILYVVVLTIFNPGYYYVIIFTLGFSAFFIICSAEKTRRRILACYLAAMVLSFIFISYKSLRHRPYDTERYLLYFANENMAGMYLGSVAVTMAALLDAAWRMHKGSLRKITLIVLHVLTGWLGVLMLYNYTRTYLTGLLLTLFVFFVIRMIRDKERRKSVVLHFALPFLTTAVMVIPGYYLIRYVPAYFNQPTYFATEYDNPTRVHPGDPVDSPKYTTLSRYLTLSLGKWGISVHLDEDYNPVEEGDDGAVSIETDRDVSNGRTYIWGLFLSRMTFAGHYPGHIIVDDDWLIYHAHNTYLQNMYQYGIPAGILFVLLIVISYLASVAGMWGHGKKTAAEVFPLLALGLMGFGMLTEWSGHPVYPFGMLLMFSLCCLIHNREQDEGDQYGQE